MNGPATAVGIASAIACMVSGVLQSANYESWSWFLGVSILFALWAITEQLKEVTQCVKDTKSAIERHEA